MSQRRLFILPSAAGFAFLFVLLVMLITAINYQNNMAYALTFLLGCVFVVAVHHTFANLHRLTLRCVSESNAFPGQQVAFTIRLVGSDRRCFQALRLGWSDPEIIVDVPAAEPVSATLYHAAPGRGWYSPGRFLLETRFPIGLLRCWTWVDLDMRALIYPRPVDPPVKPVAVGDSDDGVLPVTGHGEDLADFRDYRHGDALRSVNWRAWARGQPLTTKVYGQPQGDARWLDYSAFASGSAEERLSWLCALTLSAAVSEEPYGLRLPGSEIPPATGDSHRDRILRALALHGLESPA